MTIPRITPYEQHLIAAADEVIRQRRLVQIWRQAAHAMMWLGLVGGFPLGYLLGTAL
jgi:hypothetical protein